MKAELVPPSTPPPNVQLTMTRPQAELLRYIVCFDVSIPEMFFTTGSSQRRDITQLLRDMQVALSAVDL